MAMQAIIQKYAERLGINTEDIRNLFMAAIRSCYDGNEEAFVDDLLLGFITTVDGKADAFLYFDYLSAAAE